MTAKPVRGGNSNIDQLRRESHQEGSFSKTRGNPDRYKSDTNIETQMKLTTAERHATAPGRQEKLHVPQSAWQTLTATMLTVHVQENGSSAAVIAP
jgi:hypothetical protein